MGTYRNDSDFLRFRNCLCLAACQAGVYSLFFASALFFWLYLVNIVLKKAYERRCFIENYIDFIVITSCQCRD